MRRNRSVLYWFSCCTISKITPQRDLPEFPQVSRLNSLHRIFPVLTTPLLLAYLEQLSIAAGRIPDDFDFANGVGQRFFNIDVFTRFKGMDCLQTVPVSWRSYNYGIERSEERRVGKEFRTASRR